MGSSRGIVKGENVMGTSTNGIIGFGVPCDEECEFPWDAEEFEGDVETWWRHENGFVDIHNPWTEDVKYAAGWTKNDPRFDAYYNHRRAWLEANPVPIEAENYCSGDYPMYAITIPGVGAFCRRGDPATFDPSNLVVTPEQISALKSFLDKYSIEHNGEPRWLLMSYWG